MWEEEVTRKGFDRPTRQLTNGEILRWGKKKEYWATFIDGTDGVSYGNWKTGEFYSWFPGKEEDLMPWDLEARRAKIQQTRERIEKEKAVKQEVISDDVQTKLNSLNLGRNEYLDRKGIEGDFLIDNNKVVIPLSDINGKVWTYQTIDNQGNKLFMKGGKKKGNFYLFGELSHEKEIYLVEGFATGYSVNRGLGYLGKADLSCVAVGIDAGNVKEVCNVLLDAGYKVTICADNDEVGLRVANECGVPVIIPSLGDFNDVMVEKGVEAVAEELVKVERVDTLDTPELPQVGGLVGRIADWIMQTSRKPQYHLALGVSLSIVGTLKGHRVMTPCELRTNLMTLLVAPSASGKDRPLKAISQICKYTENLKLLAGKPASGSGVIDGLFAAGGRQITPIDEFGKYLEVVGNPNAGGWHKEIVSNWMELFSSADDLFIGKQFAQQNGKHKEPAKIDQPCLSVVGATVPDNFLQSSTV
jgi:hypothetical protein